MSTLSTMLGNLTASRQERALVKYRELLHRSDAPQKGDADALAAVMADLGRSHADVERDIATVQLARELDGRILTTEQRDAINGKFKADADENFLAAHATMMEMAQLAKSSPEVTVAVYRVLANFMGDKQRHYLTLLEGFAKRSDEVKAAASGPLDADERSRKELNQLRASNPHLFNDGE